MDQQLHHLEGSTETEVAAQRRRNVVATGQRPASHCYHLDAKDGRLPSYFLSHALLNAGQLEEHRRQKLGDDVLELLICFCMAQAKEHALQLICQKQKRHITHPDLVPHVLLFTSQVS